MITNIEKQQILHILQSPQWTTVERLAELQIDQIKEQPSIADTEWKTLQNILVKEGKIAGIREFINELYKIAKNE